MQLVHLQSQTIHDLTLTDIFSAISQVLVLGCTSDLALTEAALRSAANAALPAACSRTVHLVDACRCCAARFTPSCRWHPDLDLIAILILVKTVFVIKFQSQFSRIKFDTDL